MVPIANKPKIVIHVEDRRKNTERLWDEMNKEEQREAANHIMDEYLGSFGYVRAHRDETA